jgi:predicted alpha/beta-hydrolase family hydrolase
MRERRARGVAVGGPPDRQDVLLATWREIAGRFRGDGRLIIGGKSMGGRIASLVADECGAAGLVCLGYPFHPPGRPRQLRTAHLAELRTPTLIVQGARDALGSREEIAGYPLSPAVRVEFLEDGDHSFKPRARSGRSQEQNLREATDLVADFVRGL